MAPALNVPRNLRASSSLRNFRQSLPLYRSISALVKNTRASPNRELRWQTGVRRLAPKFAAPRLFPLASATSTVYQSMSALFNNMSSNRELRCQTSQVLLVGGWHRNSLRGLFRATEISQQGARRFGAHSRTGVQRLS